MKKILVIFAVCFLTLNFTGCATLYVEGGGQTLAMPNEAWKDYKTYKNLYLFWGLLPISDVSTKNKLPDSGKVRIKKRFNVVDWLIGGLSFGILYTETITIYSE